MQRRFVQTLAACSVVACSPTAFAFESQPTDVDLQSRVAELEAKIQNMQRADSEDWMNERRATEIRAIVQDVLTDADTRASLLQDGMTAGRDKKFFLSSSDGAFRLNIEGQMQVRYVYNLRDDGDGGAIDTNEKGFENRRTKLKFSGHVYDEWEFEVQGAFSRDGGGFGLEEAYIARALGENGEIKVGQFKLPFMREELVSSKRQLAVDRSLINEEFNQGRSQGIQYSNEFSDTFRYFVAFSDGFGTANTSALVQTTEWAFTGRGEVLFAGDWKQFKDFTSWQDEEFAFMLGFAGHIEKEESGTDDGTVDDTLFTWTVDASLEFGGANLFAAVVGRHFDEADFDQFGIVVQGGYFFQEDFEVFARFEYGDLDIDGAEELLVLTAGVNKYFHEHKLKWTTDVGIGLDTVEGPFASSGVGWNADVPDEDTQIVFRTQLQLLF